MEIKPRHSIAARAVLGWSLDDAAKRSGLSRFTIGKFETGAIKNPIQVSRAALRGAYEKAGIRFSGHGIDWQELTKKEEGNSDGQGGPQS